MRDPDRKTGFDRRNVSSGVKKCFSCGEFGHMAKDNKCQPDKKGKGTSTQMYAAREVIQEDDVEDEPSEDTEEGDDLPEGEDEDGEPYEGSQYSSEGEEFEFEVEYDDIDDVILSRLSEEHQQTNKTLGNVVREFGRRVLV
jgi:hypothetical protein